MVDPSPRAREGLRAKIHEIIVEADTPAGKAFDVALLWCIVFSVAAVMLESMEDVRQQWGTELLIAEWAFTILFSVEYGLRLYTVGQPRRYAFSFFGMVDLLAVLPTYLSLVVAGSHSLLVIRSIRLLRMFRVLKLAQLSSEASVLSRAVRASRPKIVVFLGSVVALAIIMGSVMYLIEGPEHGFTSIPRGVYWAIVTLTTVGYGDIHPHTELGQAVAAVVMVLGYGIIAVPTGIMTVELSEASRQATSTRACQECSLEGHDLDATFCKHCGSTL